MRYVGDGKSCEPPVACPAGRAVAGAAMDPAEPWRPWSEYGAGPRAVVAVGAVTVLTALLVWWTVSALH